MTGPMRVNGDLRSSMTYAPEHSENRFLGQIRPACACPTIHGPLRGASVPLPTRRRRTPQSPDAACGGIFSNTVLAYRD
jgi:hypothetical protein